MIDKEISFDEVRIFCDTNTLNVNNRVIECEPKLFELLIFLCNNPHISHSREDLITHVWHGRVVSDAAVNRAISQLRKLIEPEPSKPQYILTVSKVGYRFAVTPEVITGAKQKAEAPQKSINTDVNSLTETQVMDKELPVLKPKRQTLIIYLIALIILLIVSALGYVSINASQVKALKLTYREPISQQLGMTFNPFFHAQSETLYALHKKKREDLNQIVSIENDGNLRPLFSDNYYYTDIIRKGDFIYAARLNNVVDKHCELIKFNLSNKALNLIKPCGQSVINHLEFDDVNRLLYSYRETSSSPYYLVAINPETGRTQQITSPHNIGNSLGHRVFTVSDNLLAYMEYDANNADTLVIKNLANQKVIYSQPLVNNVYSLAWYQDQLIASAKSGLYQISIKADQVSKLDYSDKLYRIHVNDHVIYSERYQVISNLYELTSSTPSNVKALTQRQATVSLVTPGPLKDQLIYLETFGTKNHIKLQHNNQVHSLKLNEEIEYVTNFAFSKDGLTLLSNINGQIYTYNILNKQWQKESHPFDTIHFVGFDNQHNVVVSAERDQQWNIWQLTETGESIALTENGGYSFYFNKTHLYYTKFSQDGLYSMNLSTGENLTLNDAFPLLNWRHWQLLDEHVLLKMGNEYISLDLANSTLTPIEALADYGANICRRSPATTHYYCALVDSQSSQIWKTNIEQS